MILFRLKGGHVLKYQFREEGLNQQSAVRRKEQSTVDSKGGELPTLAQRANGRTGEPDLQPRRARRKRREDHEENKEHCQLILHYGQNINLKEDG